MGTFDNDDFNDDFMSRWENFNNRMMNDEEFRKEMERAQRDFKELMKMLFNPRRDFNGPLDFRIIPLRNYKPNDFSIPENEMDIQRGEDENGEWETKNWVSPDGSVSFSSFSRSSSYENPYDLPDEILKKWSANTRENKKPKVNTKEVNKFKLEKLQLILDRAVEEENYERAAEIKKMMDEIKFNEQNKTKE